MFEVLSENIYFSITIYLMLYHIKLFWGFLIQCSLKQHRKTNTITVLYRKTLRKGETFQEDIIPLSNSSNVGAIPAYTWMTQ